MTRPAACPGCGEPVEAGARVCRHCFHVLDREAWRHDAGRLGADGRGGGRELEDPPAGPLPATGSAFAGGLLGSGLRLLGVGRLLRWGRSR